MERLSDRCVNDQSVGDRSESVKWMVVKVFVESLLGWRMSLHGRIIDLRVTWELGSV